MNCYELVIVGAGPAGLAAAIEAAKNHVQVLLIDENQLPGGQLFKQIHKFFGSAAHKAGTRGYEIGRDLLREAKELNIEVWLDTEVLGIEDDHYLWINHNKQELRHIRAEKLILATGATENAVSFPGWDLPGVMGAGAAQTMINIHRVLPGEQVAMLGSGNVGVIVAYQLLQAGAKVNAIIEAAPRLGGYGVHTAKVRRAGVPFFTRHTIKQAFGSSHVEAIEMVQVDASFKPIVGTEKQLAVDTVCLAAGLTPLAELAWIAGCRFIYIPALGGNVPLHDEHMRSSLSHVYVAGDIAGIEEASTAMEEGRLAANHASFSLKKQSIDAFGQRAKEIRHSLDSLRIGQFGQRRRESKEYILEMNRGGIPWMNKI